MKNKIPTITIPDYSNGPKSLKQPKDCHCHWCIPLIVGQKGNTLIVAPHEHRGLGGWWKNGECKICDPKLTSPESNEKLRQQPQSQEVNE